MTAAAIETFVLRGLGFALAIGVNVLLARALGPEGRGEYALAILGALTLVVLGKLGLDHANVYLLGTLRIPAERLARQNLLVALAAGLPGAVLLVLAPRLLPGVFGEVPVVYLAVAAATIPIGLHLQLTAGLQNITGVVTWQFRALAAGSALQLGAYALLWAAGALDVLVALVVNLLATVLTYGFVLSRSWPWAVRLGSDASLLLRSVRYALVIHVGMVLLFLQTRLNMFVVQAVVGTVGLGHFALAVALAEALALASDSLAIALLPRQTSGDLRSAASVALRLGMVGGALVLITALPLVLFGPPLIALVFGAEFAPAYAPFLALLPGVALFAVQRFCGAPTLRANDPGRYTRIFVAGVTMNAALVLWWTPMWGLVGAGAATSVSHALTAALFLRWTRTLARG